MSYFMFQSSGRRTLDSPAFGVSQFVDQGSVTGAKQLTGKFSTALHCVLNFPALNNFLKELFKGWSKADIFQHRFSASTLYFLHHGGGVGVSGIGDRGEGTRSHRPPWGCGRTEQLRQQICTAGLGLAVLNTQIESKKERDASKQIRQCQQAD